MYNDAYELPLDGTWQFYVYSVEFEDGTSKNVGECDDGCIFFVRPTVSNYDTGQYRGLALSDLQEVRARIEQKHGKPVLSFDYQIIASLTDGKTKRFKRRGKSVSVPAYDFSYARRVGQNDQIVRLTESEC